MIIHPYMTMQGATQIHSKFESHMHGAKSVLQSMFWIQTLEHVAQLLITGGGLYLCLIL